MKEGGKAKSGGGKDRLKEYAEQKKGTSADAPLYFAASPKGKRSVDRVFQCFACTETRNFRSSDGDLFTCLRVATSTGSTLFNSKSTKTNQRNIIPGLQRLSH